VFGEKKLFNKSFNKSLTRRTICSFHQKILFYITKISAVHEPKSINGKNLQKQG